MLLGQAHLATGDDAVAAGLELGAALSVFERLGARLDIREVKRILVAIEGPQKDRERVTMTFMFTDIVTSTDLVGLIGDEKWEALLAWHHRALRETFAEHDGTEVSRAGRRVLCQFRPWDRCSGGGGGYPAPARRAFA